MSQPTLKTQHEELLELCKKLSKKEIKQMMGLSDSLSDLNFNRYQQFHTLPFLPTCWAFNGPAHSAFQISSLDKKSLKYAENSIITLSGLYGCLKPYDAIKPYRLEMGTKLISTKGKTLYDFWGDTIVAELIQMLNNNKNSKNSQNSNLKKKFIVNVASDEYWKVIKKHLSLFDKNDISIYTIKFPGPSIYAKQARGLYCRFLCERQVTDVKQLIDFESWCLHQNNQFQYSLISNDMTNNMITFERVTTTTTNKKKKKICEDDKSPLVKKRTSSSSSSSVKTKKQGHSKDVTTEPGISLENDNIEEEAINQRKKLRTRK